MRLFGYRKISFENASELSLAIASLLRSGISAQSDNKGNLYIRERDYLKNKDNILWQKAKSISKPMGLAPRLRELFKRRATLAAVIVSLLLMLASPTVVWDVRVSGNELLSERDVTSALQSLGLTVGAPWRTVDKSEIEASLLDACPEISWVNINRRGGVAYIEIIESLLPPNNNAEQGYCNVVASVDCVISEISVISGYATVSVGQSVRAGEVLISGVLPDTAGGGFCRAAGSVKGIVDDEITVNVSRIYTEKQYSEGRKSALSVKILNFSINIFKIYGNSASKYDIIKNNEKCRLFGKYDIPIWVEAEYTVPYTEIPLVRSDTELIDYAGESMRKTLLSRTESAELCRASSSGEFTDDGYTMHTSITLIEEVGRVTVFTAE